MIRLVIADDHTLMREALKLVLSAEPRLEVVAMCKDGTEAVDACRIVAPDVVLMDINMHPMNGIEATRSIRSFSDSIKIIGLSMHNDISYVKALTDAGANGYVTKNAGGDEIIHAIVTAIEGREYISDDINMLRL
ncbi:MAG: response regulator transcription factor [Chitinophagaceae bacterium]|nr:MAG: response regulator transcription factor [Chitinophagaceae bacterium]